MTYTRLGDKINGWLTEPPPKDVRDRLQFISNLEDVVGVAVMPDVHLANDFCIGTAIATKSRIYPGAIGQDIGCGMTTIQFDGDTDSITDEVSTKILTMMKRFVPILRHPTNRMADVTTDSFCEFGLSDDRLTKISQRDGRVQFGTLGRGNHFFELQADEENRLWALVHSGSRGMGHAITAHHLRLAEMTRRCHYLIDDSQAGQNYLNDAEWAISYAKQNRLQMIWSVCELIELITGIKPIIDSLIDSSHNHVRRENHGGTSLWLHRKGAQSAGLDELGIIPGSMGSSTFHVSGRGSIEAYSSCSHGAGRKLSRTEARKRITVRQVSNELRGIHCDPAKLNAIREEAPSAYKDIRKVVRAQKKLVRICRELRPLLNYKGV